MRISFDLDDTLICYQPGACHEPAPRWYRRLLAPDEPIRAGAPALLRTLRGRGWDVWVYTTSYRPPWSIRRWLWAHGVWVGGVVNQDVHDRRLKRTRDDDPPSKNPRAFGIDLHVDDSDGVRQEGHEWGFRVVVVDPDDPGWADKVLAAAVAVERGRAS